MTKIEEAQKKNIKDKVKIQDYLPGLADPQYDASFTAPKVKSIKKYFLMIQFTKGILEVTIISQRVEETLAPAPVLQDVHH